MRCCHHALSHFTLEPGNHSSYLYEYTNGLVRKTLWYYYQVIPRVACPYSLRAPSREASTQVLCPSHLNMWCSSLSISVDFEVLLYYGISLFAPFLSPGPEIT